MMKQTWPRHALLSVPGPFSTPASAHCSVNKWTQRQGLEAQPAAALRSSYILFVALGLTMTEDFRKQHAQAVRAMAEKADPFTKKRLLDLADRYDRQPRAPLPIPSISAELAQ